jgi:hypothetical protein
VFPVKAQMFHCHRQTTERQFCNAKQSECGADSDAFNSRCLVGGWSDWTEWWVEYISVKRVKEKRVFYCSTVKCGRGDRRRERHLLNNGTTAAAQCNVELTAVEQCVGQLDGIKCIDTLTYLTN